MAYFDQISKKNLKNFVYRQPTDDLPRFTPTDDLQGSS